MCRASVPHGSPRWERGPHMGRSTGRTRPGTVWGGPATAQNGASARVCPPSPICRDYGEPESPSRRGATSHPRRRAVGPEARAPGPRPSRADSSAWSPWRCLRRSHGGHQAVGPERQRHDRDPPSHDSEPLERFREGKSGTSRWQPVYVSPAIPRRCAAFRAAATLRRRPMRTSHDRGDGGRALRRTHRRFRRQAAPRNPPSEGSTA